MRASVRTIVVILAVALGVPLLEAGPAGALPVAPTLTAPASGTTGAENPTMMWNEDLAADYYKIQLSTDPGFASTIVSTNTYNTNYVHDEELPTGTIYWRVQSHDSSGFGPFSSVRTYNKTDRDVPIPLDPPNNATLIYPSDPIVVTWQTVPGAKSYNVQFDNEPTFTSPLLGNSNSDNDGATVSPDLAMDTPVYWRVRALLPDGQATQYSATRQFTVSWPEVPQLVSPPNTFSPTIDDVILDWEPLSGAQTYNLQISPNIDFTNNTLNVNNLEATTYSPEAALKNGSYYWRVRAEHVWGGFGGWSQVYGFTREWPPNSAPVQLIAPADGDFDVPEPNFSWEPQHRASHYTIEWSLNETFSSIVKTCTTDHTNITPYSGCTFNPIPGVQYYWHVRSEDSPGNVHGVWSDTWSFIYNHRATAPVSPADGATTSVPVLEWTSVPDIGHYEVTVKKVSNGATVDSNDVYNTKWVPDSTTLSDSPVYWYVQTIDDDGNLGPVPPPSEWRTLNIAAPLNTYPTPEPTSASGVAGATPPLLTWQPVTGATKYEVWMRPQGSPTWIREGSNLKYPAYAHPDGDLANGTYEWYVEAFNGNAPLGSGTPSLFVITPMSETHLVSPTHCPPLSPCNTIFDTPTLDWDPVPTAEYYVVTIATDVNFTNVIKTYSTRFTQLRPKESLVDAQAGQALYWYAKPCYSNHCGFNPSTFAGNPNSPVFAFRKQSAAIEALTPAANATDADEITFTWRDFLDTNLDLDPVQTQEAERYRIQVSGVPDFSSNVHTSDYSDETTYTAPFELYPDGPLYWRVQSRDNTGNLLTWSPTRQVNKVTPAPTLLTPAAGASIAGSLPEFTWTLEPFARSYDIEIYENVDQPLASGNIVYSDNVPTPGAYPEEGLPPGTYGWRVRKRDTSGNLLQWSAANNSQLRLFTIPPDTAELTSPADGAGVQNNDVLLTWLPATHAAQYRVQVSTSSAFAGTLVNEVVTPTAYAPTVKIPDGHYYWRVLSLDGAGNTIGTSETWTFETPVTSPDLRYTSIAPVRIQDSRPLGPQVGPYGTRWGAGTDREIQVSNVFGIPADADAVTLNVTVTNTTAPSFLTIYPNGDTRPLASNLNWSAGGTIANAVTVKVGTGGKIRVYNPTGQVDVIIDAVGYYRTAGGAGFTSLAPVRIQDSRPSGPKVGPYSTPWTPGTDRTIHVAGEGGVPADAEAVVVNTTVTNTTQSSFLTVYPNGSTKPLASSINWFPGQTIANAVTVKVGTGGNIRAYSPTGNVDVIMDVVGYFKTGTGYDFHAMSPVRIQDSRPSGPKVGPYSTPWSNGTDRTITVAGTSGIPAYAQAVMLNATVTNTTEASFLTVYPAGTTRPLASSLNWAQGWTIPNAITAKVGSSQQIRAYNPTGKVDVIMDANGWYG